VFFIRMPFRIPDTWTLTKQSMFLAPEQDGRRGLVPDGQVLVLSVVSEAGPVCRGTVRPAYIGIIVRGTKYHACLLKSHRWRPGKLLVC
jgi:hypothetical protein